MKVLMVTNMYPSPELPGWGAFVKSQIDSLARKGIDIELLVIDGYKNVVRYGIAFFRIRSLCSRGKYDLVHAHFGLSGLVARGQYRFPVLVSFCGDDLLGTPGRDGKPTAKSRILVRIHKWLAGKVDGVIVKSKAMRNHIPGVEAVVIPNGVRFDQFFPMDPTECRRRLNLREDRVYLLFPYSPDVIRKNYRLLENAVAILNSERGAVRVEILVVDNISQDLMPLYMNASDVLVLPSFWEGSPNAVKEAMACNTRIVATDVGDVRDVIDGVEGCRICECIAADLADKIRQVLGTPFKTSGREKIGDLAIEIIADKVIVEYERILDKRVRNS